jgi:hypothetical protein
LDNDSLYILTTVAIINVESKLILITGVFLLFLTKKEGIRVESSRKKAFVEPGWFWMNFLVPFCLVRVAVYLDGLIMVISFRGQKILDLEMKPVFDLSLHFFILDKEGWNFKILRNGHWEIKDVFSWWQILPLLSRIERHYFFKALKRFVQTFKGIVFLLD